MGRKRALKQMRRDAAYILIRSSVGIFRLLPRKAALAVGSVLGRFASRVFRAEYRLAVEHLTLSLGKEYSASEIQRLARESFRFVALNFVDAARIEVMSPDEIREVCVPHDIDRVRTLTAKGRGVILISSHSGCWEMLGGYLALMGVPVAVVARRLYDPRLEKILYRSRLGAGMRVISLGQNTRDILRALQEGYALGMLIDQDMKVKGIFVDFFGRPAHTPSAPAALALRYGLPVLPIFTWRDKQDRHHFCARDLIRIEETGDSDRDVAALTEKCSGVIEEFIREHPEQWVWFHRRWKTRPEPVLEGAAR